MTGNCEYFYPRTRRSVPAARELTRRTLTEWGIGTPRVDDIVLCVSELATNALLHGVPPGRGFRIHIRLEGSAVLRIELHDSGDGEPRIPVEAADESGRGLLLVEALSDKWGVGERVPGKIVWCEFSI
ncbi:ATP-binding protein [Streptomyces sp. NBC_01262]|jgi:anti-sigma regulatory factor (Ser/Thr protein kinase)|uniref:ATP-binding protein n=1 Tax=Streptomyces sp. NBC_01262 TaxID=2903803 RepID=UPI002E33DFA1|nr:ATP-binding protein [Streptomyces sp. NBC_01262]